MKNFFFALFAVSMTSCTSNEGHSKENGNVQIEDSMEVNNENKDTTFCFVCKGINRDENFDSCPTEVTTDNVKNSIENMK